MKKLTHIIILSLLFLIVGCSTDIESLQERNNLYYKVNSDKPFSGSILTKYESGQKKTKGYLKEGKWEGLYTEWYKNDQMSLEGTLKEGKPDGLSTSWYENGQRKGETTFKDGIEDGLSTKWYENGQKKTGGTIKNGKQDGHITDWYENGQKKIEINYKNGGVELIGCWKKDGSKRKPEFYELSPLFKEQRP